MADLSLVDGRYARMEGADLRGARLDRAIFAGAMTSEVLASPMPIRGRADWPTNLTSTRLTAVCLAGADLNRARLGRADLSKADLHSANLCGASLCEAVLTGADLSNVKLEGADLTACVGLPAL
jgi:uncharacterized protein YjbI with pentapeptide repeats